MTHGLDMDNVMTPSSMISMQTSLSDPRKGKTRTSINSKQLEILQAAYDKEPRPSRIVREELAGRTGLTAKVSQFTHIVFYMHIHLKLLTYSSSIIQ